MNWRRRASERTSPDPPCRRLRQGWNRRRRLLCGANRDIPGAKDDIGFRFDQLHCNGWKLLGAQSIATPINRKISTLDEPKPAQFMTKRDIMWRVAGAE